MRKQTLKDTISKFLKRIMRRESQADVIERLLFKAEHKPVNSAAKADFEDWIEEQKIMNRSW